MIGRARVCCICTHIQLKFKYTLYLAEIVNLSGTKNGQFLKIQSSLLVFETDGVKFIVKVKEATVINTVYHNFEWIRISVYSCIYIIY